MTGAVGDESEALFATGVEFGEALVEPLVEVGFGARAELSFAPAGKRARALPDAAATIEVVDFLEGEVKGGGDGGWAVGGEEFEATAGGLNRGG